MQTSSARPYLLVFALVALAAAGFILKQELSTADKPADMADVSSPQRLLVAGSDGQVPEKYDDWFKRVGYQKLGFDSQSDMDQTKAMLTTRGGEMTPEQLKLLHKIIATKGVPSQLGISLLPGLRTPEQHKEFLPDVKALYAKDSPNQNFRTVLSSWYRRDKDTVVSLEKDSDKGLADCVTQLVLSIEFPGKDG